EGRRTKDEGRRTKDEGRRTKDEGRRHGSWIALAQVTVPARKTSEMREPHGDGGFISVLRPSSSVELRSITEWDRMNIPSSRDR
ncbi:MAG TPA: hypothetical protein VFJ58_30215, partial [Armatimonadota bacterium]|nr:hypothetical protein [Armatimonadota bacterium]